MTAVERITAALDEREAMIDAATRGPWRLDTRVRGDVVVWAGKRDTFVANIEWDHRADGNREPAFDLDGADGALIVAAVNQQRALIAQAREVLALAEAMLRTDRTIGEALIASLLDAWCPS